jgi:transcriptional regulator with XRE-family HTH domain
MTPSIDKKAFGQFIGRRREQRGLSQGAMAQAAGISRPYLTQIDSGARTPSEDVMQRLVILSGASMEDFLKEVVASALTPDQMGALGTLLQPYDAITEQLTPEQVLEITEQMLSAEQIAEALGKLSGLEGPQIGPEGWADLSKEDRRLVQRLINRLRDPASDKEEGE